MHNKYLVLIGAFSAMFVFSGCGITSRFQNGPRVKVNEPVDHASFGAGEEIPREEFSEPTGEITLADAFAASLLNHPKLARYEWQVRVREAQTLQAGFLPNPEFEIEVEEFFGSGDSSGFDSAETTLLYSQLIELGQKRQKRTTAIQLHQELATWDYEAARVSVLADVARVFTEILSLQERSVMMQENLNLAQEVHDTIGKRVKAGAASPLDLTKAEVEVVKEKIKLQRIHRELKSAHVYLAAKWGSRQPKFDRVKGDFSVLPVLPSIEALSKRISENPQVARWAAEITQRKAQIEYEESKAVSDMEIGFGVRHLNEPNDVAAVFNLSIPLAVFNRNQGKVRQAHYELEVTRHRKGEAELRINTVLSKSYQDLSGVCEELQALETQLLPVAKRAYDDTHTAFVAGKVGYLQVLDTQRTLFEARGEYLEALVLYHAIAVEIEGLIGRPLSEINRN